MDVTLTLFPFPDGRKDVAGTIIDSVMFGVLELFTLKMVSYSQVPSVAVPSAILIVLPITE